MATPLCKKSCFLVLSFVDCSPLFRHGALDRVFWCSPSCTKSCLLPTSLCGVLVFDSVSLSSSSSPPPPPPPPPPHTTLSHTQLGHTDLCHTQLCHTQLCHHSFVTHNFVTHHLSQTTLSHTHIFVIHDLVTLSHTRIFVTHNCVTHTTLSRTTLSHTTLSRTIFAWQAWHLATFTCTLRGRRGTWRHRPLFCVAAIGVTGMALVALDLALVARLVAVSRPGHRGTLRGRRGNCSHPPSFCVAGVALGDIYLRLAWQAWHLGHWAGSGGELGRR